MPIVVVILGVVIVVMSVLLFVLEPAPKEATTEPEANQSESIEVDTQAEIDVSPINVDSETEMEASEPTSQNTKPAVPIDVVTYTGTGTYLTPARTNHEIEVSLTLKDGVVIEADVVYDGGAGYSNPNQERFDKAYESSVIGQNLSDISLSRVGGASLTSQAFNEAVAQIKTQQST